MVDMTTPSRRIYNRTASAHINVSSPTSPPPSSPAPPAPQARKPASPPPPTISAPPVPVGAKKKKKKRSKGKTGGGAGNDTPLADEELDYSRRGFEDDQDLTDDDIPELVDIEQPAHNQAPSSISVAMTANSSASSKTPTTTSA